MVSEVLFIEHRILEGLRKAIHGFAKERFSKGEQVAIKLHMGEFGTLFYLRPSIVSLIVEELKGVGAKPFLFDSPVVYSGSRDSVAKYYDTAKRHGFTEESMGCPIVISNEGVAVKTKLGEFELCKPLIEADGMVVLSHFKAHSLTNYGGAIKNLGMGGLTKEGKGKLHSVTGAYIANLEACIGCGACVGVCPFHLLEVKDNKITMQRCVGCCACVLACPNGVLKPRTVPLSKGLAIIAKQVLSRFDSAKVVYVNVLMDIAEVCDCTNQGFTDSGSIKLVSPNLGILVARDIVAIDQASLDLVNEATNGKFSGLWGPDAGWQTEEAAALGLGSKEYKLLHSE